MIARTAKRIGANAALAAFVIMLSCVLCQPAFAASLEELELEYQAAYANYESAVGEQEENSKKIEDANSKIKATEGEISQKEGEITVAESELEKTKQSLKKTAIALYKDYPSTGSILDVVLQCSNIEDAIRCLEGYYRIQKSYTDELESLRNQKAQLELKRDELQKKKSDLDSLRKSLEEEKKAIDEKVKNAKISAAESLAALEDADHSDGYEYHQRQGNNKDCGATAFIVGVNALLHENRYTDNVAVWASRQFAKDSTGAIARKGRDWLNANGLGDEIEIYNVPGDIHTAAKMQAELEQGHVVITSSGPGSIWQYVSGPAKKGAHGSGHYIVFYYYEDGIFYANDSSRNAGDAGGCPYTESQMQQWLDGRAKHYSVVMRKIPPESYLDEEDIAQLDKARLPDPKTWNDQENQDSKN